MWINLSYYTLVCHSYLRIYKWITSGTAENTILHGISLKLSESGSSITEREHLQRVKRNAEYWLTAVNYSLKLKIMLNCMLVNFVELDYWRCMDYVMLWGSNCVTPYFHLPILNPIGQKLGKGGRVMGISTTLEEAADAARVARTGAVRPGARRGGGARMIYP